MSLLSSRSCFVVVLAALLLLGVACGGGGNDEPVSPPDGEAPVAAESDDDAGAEPTPIATSNVEIYFPSNNGDGLIGEYREIFLTTTPGDRAKQIIADLISGPTSSDATRALPAGTQLRQVYVLSDGVAWLDFSTELTEGIGGGSTNEVLTVYAVVDSVIANVSEIKQIGFLVNGRPIETLNGHLDLRSPLKPDFTLVRGSAAVRGPASAVAGSVS